jgi:hypothetical protein
LSDFKESHFNHRTFLEQTTYGSISHYRTVLKNF